jgi:alkylation response protein AidB-like acyl-CoA dehydrogenase
MGHCGLPENRMKKTIDETIDYTRQRKAFGKPLLDNQVIHFRLAELKTEVELLRSCSTAPARNTSAGMM